MQKEKIYKKKKTLFVGTITLGIQLERKNKKKKKERKTKTNIEGDLLILSFYPQSAPNVNKHQIFSIKNLKTIYKGYFFF